jgi:serine phosphatase RsbU (regulator of sigma subunit)
VASTVIAIGISLALRPVLDTTTLSPFYGSVVIAVWYGGLGPGLVGLFLALCASAVALWHPVFGLSSSAGHQLPRWLIFGCLGALIVAFGNELHRRQEVLEEESDELYAVQGLTEIFSRAKSPTDVAGAVLTRGLRVVGATSGAVFVFDEELNALVLQRSAGFTPELTELLRRVPLDAPVAVATATRTGEPVLLRGPAELAHQYGKVAAYLAVGRAFAAIPLFHRSRPLGALFFAYAEEQDFSDALVSSIVALADLSEQALARAKEQQAEHAISLTLQRSLLPLRMPDFSGMEVAVDYLAGAAEADVGGDWYDGVLLDDGRVVLTIGDIAGRGVQAAALMSRLRIALKCYAVDGSGPAEALARLDVFIAHLPEDYFATVVMIRADPETREVEYACAGHPPPVLIPGNNGRASFLKEGRSGPIDVGVRPSERIQASTRLEPGDTLLLYTDGLIEQREKPLSDGLQLLLDSLEDIDDSSARALVDGLVSRLRAEHRMEDDVALLAVRFVEPAGDGRHV